MAYQDHQIIYIEKILIEYLELKMMSEKDLKEYERQY